MQTEGDYKEPQAISDVSQHVMGAPVSPQEVHPAKGRFINPINIPIHLWFPKFLDQTVALSRKSKLSSRKTLVNVL